ncbi:MAG TPA: 4a-hydroxytetrahydrobiopterin dehydratase [Flavobacteriales bacterium]|nr:4a-hydroxytetrahydrobiopterin dehydratase [Flavobacteriales bacterium]
MKHTIDENEFRIILNVETGNYPDSVAMSIKAFLLAEKMNHHPTVTTNYAHVTIEICTHDAGNKVTEKDKKYIQTLVASISK